MQPFRVIEHLVGLERDYPPATRVIDAVAQGADRSAREIALLWLSEGVPWLFRDQPALFVAVRSWVAAQLGVECKSVTLVGSARLGASLAPGEVGKPFGRGSDLDFAIVSPELFASCEEAFRRWSNDYTSGTASPTDKERKYWDANQGVIAANVRVGFIDPWKVPLRRRYRESQMVVETTATLTRKLAVTNGAPQVADASARVYRDWESFARQVGLNLASAAERSA